MQEMQETPVWSLSQEDPPEEGMAADSNILALRIPWREEPVKPQSIGFQRIGHDWACMHKNTSVYVYSLSLHFKKFYEPYKNCYFLFSFNWRITALQCCDGLCCTSMWMSYIYIYIYIYISPPSWASPLHSTTPIPHRASGWAPSVIQQLPASYLFYTWYWVCVCMYIYICIYVYIYIYIYFSTHREF